MHLLASIACRHDEMLDKLPQKIIRDEIEHLKDERLELGLEARQQELWQARLELGYMRETPAETGAEEVYDGTREAVDEQFIFAALPSTSEGTPTVEWAHSPIGSPKRRISGTWPRSPALNPEALAQKHRRMQILTNKKEIEAEKKAFPGMENVDAPPSASAKGWASQAATDSYHMQQRKAVIQRQMQQLKNQIQLLLKSRSEVVGSIKCPVPMTAAIERAKDEVGGLDDENEFSRGFVLHPVPSHALLLTEARRKQWYFKMKAVIQCRVRLRVILNHELIRLQLHEMEPPEPLFPTKQLGTESNDHANPRQGWYDEIVGPAFDYDYASINSMGHPGVVGFTIMTKAALQPLRDKRRAVQKLRCEEEENLRQVMQAADIEHEAQRQSLTHEMGQNELLQTRTVQSVRQARHLDDGLQRNEEELMVLRRQRDEAEVVLRRQRTRM